MYMVFLDGRHGLFALFSDLFLGFVWILGQIERLLLLLYIYIYIYIEIIITSSKIYIYIYMLLILDRYLFVINQ